MIINQEYTLNIEYSPRGKRIKYIIEGGNCWIQISHSIYKDGYPRYTRKYKNKSYTAMHRFIYSYFIGDLNENEVVRHSCGNRNCINPEHMTKDSPKKDYTSEINKKYGRLTIIRVSNKRESRKLKYFDCICECGNTVTTDIASLRRGHVKSCGCLRKERSFESTTTHNKSYTRIYRIYQGVKYRCYNIACPRYKNYGGRGIKVCDEWLNDFMNFYNWAIENGYQENLTLDRINVNGNYEPENCRWISNLEQQSNRRNSIRVVYDGEDVLLIDLLRRLKRENEYGSIRLYIKRDGMTIYEALNYKSNRLNKINNT